MRLSKSDIESDIKKQLSNEISTLKNIEDLIRPKEAQVILAKSAEPILSKMVANLLSVVDKSENLSKSFKIFKGKKASAQYKVYIGPSYGKYGSGQAAHLIEYGTVERTRRSISQTGGVKMVSTGAMPARPFMRPAWEQTKEGVIDSAEKGFIKYINTALKKKGFK